MNIARHIRPVASARGRLPERTTRMERIFCPDGDHAGSLPWRSTV